MSTTFSHKTKKNTVHLEGDVPYSCKTVLQDTILSDHILLFIDLRCYPS